MQEHKSVICIAALALLLYSMYALVSAREEHSKVENTVLELEREYELKLSENEKLRLRLETGDSRESIEALARDRLGMVYPGEIVYYFINSDRED